MPGTTPLVNGAPTTLLTLSRTELTRSPLLEPLFALVNAAFGSTHGPPYMPDGLPRYPNSTQMVAGIDPCATIYLLVDSAGRVAGSVTDEPYNEPTVLPEDDQDSQDVFTPRLDGDGSLAYRRVLRLLVTDPTLHRSGIGSWLLRHLEVDLVRAARAQSLSRVHWVLTTVAEINSGYYAHRGWRVIRSQRIPAQWQGIVTISSATMDKIIEVGLV